ncbi:hypothetical protein UPYG_G00150440 [Umbra pygmaea]|uniref:Dendritic cell-specific transmembrane protein-like domain-containing protein n=1 Tax=Umbra pygmaea TaxID=75934 RepID=A0ABD0WY33_UMBPY
MHACCPQFRHTLYRLCSTAAELYTTNTRRGWKERLILFITCLAFSLALNSTLLLYLHHVLQYGLPVAFGIVGPCWGIVGVCLFLSKRVRCFGVLFVLSLGMKQGRNLLIAFGTSLVLLKNFQNMLENFIGLTMSMVCILQAKILSINTTPLGNYVRMLKWIGGVLREFTDFGVAELVSDLEVTSTVDSDKLREKLVGAAGTLNGTAESIRATMATLSSLNQRLFPALSVLLIMGFTMLHLRRYQHNKKYENIYITRAFIRFDEKQKAEGRLPVIPLTPEEVKRYSSIHLLQITAVEWKNMLKFSLPVFTHCLAWLFFIGVDVLMFWLVEVIRTHLQEVEPFNVPLIMNINEDMTIIGVPVSKDIKRMDFSYQLSLFETRCLPSPTLLLYDSILPLVGVLMVLLIMVLMSSKLQQVRLLICEQFFSTAAEERVQYLHSKILKRRSREVRKVKAKDRGLRSLLKRPDFWFPILCRPEEENAIQQES